MRIVKVCWDCDDSFFYGSTEVRLGGLFALGQDEGADLGWGVLLASGLDPGVSVAGADDFVRKMFDVFFSLFVIKSTSNQSFSCE